MLPNTPYNTPSYTSPATPSPAFVSTSLFFLAFNSETLPLFQSTSYSLGTVMQGVIAYTDEVQTCQQLYNTANVINTITLNPLTITKITTLIFSNTVYNPTYTADSTISTSTGVSPIIQSAITALDPT